MDVLVIVGDFEAPPRLAARAAHQLRTKGGALHPDLVAELRGRIPREVGVVGDVADAAAVAGELHNGGTIVEPTSGNTGVGLAIAAARRRYRCIFTMPDKIASEKMALLRAYGAEVIVCPTSVAPEHPESYYSVASRLAEEIP